MYISIYAYIYIYIYIYTSAGAQDCTPEIDALEIIPDLRGVLKWIFGGVFRLMLTCSVASPKFKGLSLSQWTSTGVVQWILAGIFRWMLTSASSGEPSSAPSLGAAAGPGFAVLGVRIAVDFRNFVFLGPRPWHIEIRHRVKKTSTINLFGFETLKLKIRRLKLWKPTVAVREGVENRPRTSRDRTRRAKKALHARSPCQDFAGQAPPRHDFLGAPPARMSS